jgi:hypothetical protein
LLTIFLTAIIQRPACPLAIEVCNASQQAGGLFFRIEKILMLRLNFDIIFVMENVLDGNGILKHGELL